MVIARSALAKSKNVTYVFIEKAEKFIHKIKQEIFCLQNHIPNMNMKKIEIAYQEKYLILNLDEIMILMYSFVRKTGNNFEKQQKVLPLSSNLFQLLLQVLLSQYL